MAIGVTGLEQHWIGDLKLHTATVTVNTTGVNALAANAVGLQTILGVLVLQGNATVQGAAWASGTLTVYGTDGAVPSGAASQKLGFIGW
jgi:hypothetical protein